MEWQSFFRKCIAASCVLTQVQRSRVFTPAAATSDYVKLVSTDFSNVSSMSLDGYYSSTYDNYRAVISNFYASSGADVHFSFRAGNSQITDSNYQKGW